MVGVMKNVGLKLSKGKLAALKRAAKRLGMTPDEYAIALINDGLAREQRIRETSLEVLAKPMHDALQGMTEEEVDAMVEEGRHHGGQKRRSR
jgi:hypothetical protein